MLGIVMLEILGSVISVVSAANDIHDTYRNIGTLMRGSRRSDKYLAKLSEEMGGIRDAPSLAGITDPTQSRQRCVETLREARELLEPIQRETGDTLLSSALIWTPQRFKSAMGKDPWEVLEPIHPLNRARVLNNPDKLPVLFLDNGVYYIGWTMRGELPGMFGCEAHDQWVRVDGDSIHSAAHFEKSINAQAPLDTAKLFYQRRSENFLSSLNALALDLITAIPQSIHIINAQQEMLAINKMIRELKIVLEAEGKSEGNIPQSRVQVLCGTTNVMITIRNKDNSLTRYKITYLTDTDIQFNLFTKLSHILFILGYEFNSSNHISEVDLRALGLTYNAFSEINESISNSLDHTLSQIKEKLLSYPDEILFHLYYLNENRIFTSRNEVVAFEQARCQKLFAAG